MEYPYLNTYIHTYIGIMYALSTYLLSHLYTYLRVTYPDTYEGESISNQPIPFPMDRDGHDFHALF